MKLFITQYALTKGILEVDGRVSESCPTMVVYCVGDSNWQCYANYDDWHTTREAAVKRAEEMRLAKIKTLEKSLAKFRKMRFTC